MASAQVLYFRTTLANPLSIHQLFLASFRPYIALHAHHGAIRPTYGLCDGVLTGAEALAGFPSLHTLPHTALLGSNGVNVHGSESRNKSMVVAYQEPV